MPETLDVNVGRHIHTHLLVLKPIWSCAVLTKTNHTQIKKVTKCSIRGFKTKCSRQLHYLVLRLGKENFVLNDYGMINCAEKNYLIEY